MFEYALEHHKLRMLLLRKWSCGREVKVARATVIEIRRAFIGKKSAGNSVVPQVHWRSRFFFPPARWNDRRRVKLQPDVKRPAVRIKIYPTPRGQISDASARNFSPWLCLSFEGKFRADLSLIPGPPRNFQRIFSFTSSRPRGEIRERETSMHNTAEIPIRCNTCTRTFVINYKADTGRIGQEAGSLN